MSISVGVLGYLFPDIAKINGVRRQLDQTELLMALILGLIFLILFFAIKHRIVLVDLGSNSIKIIKPKEIMEANWMDVKFVNKIHFIKPPLYRIKLKNTKNTYLLTT